MHAVLARRDGRAPAVAPAHRGLAPASIRIPTAGAGLLAWDEARADYTGLDLADLPGSGLPPSPGIMAQLARRGRMPPYSKMNLNYGVKKL